MLIPLGFLSAGGTGASFELISTTLITTNTPSVTFNVSSFASTYKHLQIRMVTRSSTTYGDDVILRFNSDSGSNYAHHLLVGNGSVVNGYNGTTQSFIKGGYTIASDQTASSFGVGVVDILDPFSTSKNKFTRNLTGGSATGGSGSQIQLWSGAWYSISAVTSITLSTYAAANFTSGSRFSLYGVHG